MIAPSKSPFVGPVVVQSAYGIFFCEAPCVLTSAMAGALSSPKVKSRYSRRGRGVEAARNARGRPADQQVRYKGEHQCDDHRLARVEPSQDDDLVHRVHHDAEQD